MWKWIGQTGQNIVGVPSDDFSDEAFAAVQTEYEKGFPGVEPGVLERCGLWEHTADEPAREPPPTAGPEAEAPAPPAEEEPPK